MSEPYNDLKQVEMLVMTAEKMVGSATMSMDKESLSHATQAVENARQQLNDTMRSGTGVDGEFLAQQQVLLSKCEEQLNEAKQ